MIVAEFLLILLLAFVLAAVFAFPLGRPGPWGGFWWFFLVLFLGTWAIAAWIQPIGPVAWGVAWAPILVGAVLIALLVAAIPPRPTTTPTEVAAEAEAATAIGAFFWMLLLGLLVVIGLSFAFA